MSSLQPCRAALARTPRLAARASACVRSYASSSSSASTTTPTQESSSSSSSFSSDAASTSTSVPRWSQTPPAMKAGFQLDHAIHPHNKVWTVNNDPRKLDEMYDRLLGSHGRKVLPEELKWLAVTHKSFDQGRRGFNDRLALLGRMALIMESTKQIVAKEPLDGAKVAEDAFDREPFAHPQLASVDNLAVQGPKDVAGKEKLYQLGIEVGLIDVVRWKPRLTGKLKSSGVEVVLTSAILAIIGAVTLQHGAAVASQVIRERILARVQN